MFLQFNTNNSWWPLFMSFSLFFVFINLINYQNNMNFLNLMLSLTIMVTIMILWFRDLQRESNYLGGFNILMQMSFKLGMTLFILSEFMFFFSFFWTYFHFMFMFDMQLGFYWPPNKIQTVSYMSIPLLNTMLLLSSGVSLTLSHHFFLSNKNANMKMYLLITILLGLIFTVFQIFEYYMIEFLWSEGSYSSIFFMGTGFHGVHVTIGTLMLITITTKMFNNFININSTFFEMAAWYWHFVDMVWLLLFTEFYWWSN